MLAFVVCLHTWLHRAVFLVGGRQFRNGCTKRMGSRQFQGREDGNFLLTLFVRKELAALAGEVFLLSGCITGGLLAGNTGKLVDMIFGRRYHVAAILTQLRVGVGGLRTGRMRQNCLNGTAGTSLAVTVCSLIAPGIDILMRGGWDRQRILIGLLFVSSEIIAALRTYIVRHHTGSQSFCGVDRLHGFDKLAVCMASRDHDALFAGDLSCGSGIFKPLSAITNIVRMLARLGTGGIKAVHPCHIVLMVFLLIVAAFTVAHTATDAVVAIGAEFCAFAAGVAVDTPVIGTVFAAGVAFLADLHTCLAGITNIAPGKGTAPAQLTAVDTDIFTIAAGIAFGTPTVSTLHADGIAAFADIHTITAGIAFGTPVVGAIHAKLHAALAHGGAICADAAITAKLNAVFAHAAILTENSAVFTNTATLTDHDAIAAVFLTLTAKLGTFSTSIFTAGADGNTVPAGIAASAASGGVTLNTFFTNGAGEFLCQTLFALIAAIAGPVDTQKALSALRTSALVVGNAFIAKLAACIGAAVTAVTFHTFSAGLTLRCALDAEAAFLAFYRRAQNTLLTDNAPGIIFGAAIYAYLLTAVGAAVSVTFKACIAVLANFDTILTDPACIAA